MEQVESINKVKMPIGQRPKSANHNKGIVNAYNINAEVTTQNDKKTTTIKYLCVKWASS